MDGSILALGGAGTAKLCENSAVPARFERATCGSEGLRSPTHCGASQVDRIGQERTGVTSLGRAGRGHVDRSGQNRTRRPRTNWQWVPTGDATGDESI